MTVKVASASTRAEGPVITRCHRVMGEVFGFTYRRTGFHRPTQGFVLTTLDPPPAVRANTVSKLAVRILVFVQVCTRSQEAAFMYKTLGWRWEGLV